MEARTLLGPGWTLEDLLYAPPAIAALSVVYLSAKLLQVFFSKKKSKDELILADAGHPTAGLLERPSGFLEILDAFDGPIIVLCRFVRLLLLFALLSLEVFMCSTGEPFYTIGLAVASICTSSRWRDITSHQLALLLFADFIAYFILDAWPYATIEGKPRDSPSQVATWSRLILLTLSGLIVPLAMPRPFRPSMPGAEPSASETASLFSCYTFSYLDGIILYATRVPDVTVKDMPQIPAQGRIEALAERVLSLLDLLRNGKRHFLWGVFRVWGKDYLILNLIWGANAIVYMETGVSPYNLKPWVWVIARVIVENSSAFTYIVFHHALRIRLRSNALDSDEKGEKGNTATPSVTNAEEASAENSDEVNGSDPVGAPVSDAEAKPVPEGGHAKEKTGHLLGKINNLITTDIEATSRSPFFVSLPGTVIQLVISIIFLYDLLGWSSFVGLAVMVICFPIPFYAGQRMAKIQKSKMAATDKRVQYVTEAMGILRMIKLFGWESYMLKQLSHRREEELSKIMMVRVLEALMNVTSSMLPLLSKLVVISIYTLVSKGELKASTIFAALMVFSMMEEQLHQFMFVFPEILRAKVSYDPFNEFLNSTELLSEGNAHEHQSEDNEQTHALVPEQPAHDVVGFKQCSFSWDPFDNNEPTVPSSNHQARRRFVLRFDDEVIFKHGEINLIVGLTASGKTSVLMALLGEMYYKPHGIGSWYNLPRDGGVAYAPQESWVLNETIRDNILFGEPYEEGRYKQVLKQCALERDLELWKAGDLTEARVTLARALYSSASIILLDDVLAALDVHTAKSIVENALQGDLVQGRTVLLVTHNIALAAPVAAYVVALGGHGTISAQGPVAEVLKRNSRLRAQVESAPKEIVEDIDSKLNERTNDKDANIDDKKAAGKLVVAEEKQMGRVALAAIMLYLTSVGGPFVWMLILGSRVFETLVYIGSPWFMGYWSNQYTTRPPDEVPVLRYLCIFALINVTQFFAELVSQVYWIFRSVRAARIIHSHLLQSIFTSTFCWLDLTPVGRIVTRCTQDTSTIDTTLGHMMSPFLAVSITLIGLFISSIVMAGWYAFVSGLTITILGGSLGLVYLKCQMCIRREMSNAKAPVMSQVGAALAGLPSIRAYNAQKIFDTELRKRIDIYARTARWVSIRMDGLGAIFAGSVAAYLVYGEHVEAGYAGFTLSVVLQFSRLILSWVRLLERMLEFMRINHEPEPSESGKPPAYWPSSGALRVENLSAKYSDDAPTILRNISFKIEPGERVGIVGRTGAGKSSMALALLRAIKTEGKVYYDGIATDEINLDTLRSNITLIPQQPELIHGTLRENLDPFNQYDDAVLNDALIAAGLFNIKDGTQASGSQTVQSASDVGRPAKIGLDTMVESDGTNFSLGQRQIIALARAIVRKSKLLILDEATAAIDYDTDAAIQKTLRTEFSSDTTLLTIAHRLQTIIDYDKVMVLDAGELVEFDSPSNLLRKERGVFRVLVEESDDRDLLRRLAGEQ
ncbi:P-loop containing nucleoside triphosphate hydrolase protein [Fomitiporia mediterranea MF3/22]|uniref:P-loop containing nucleoside triphosphate hydrolase protein n=1 Tax=Fomitiporia mediterranea (strain MF3/22) TaxID=694068 RepID=UPI000440857E|nr:P-loop containing nucleoside triphosphate hydrolase protein [Fomitiporia mediterranea MF3/22]EJC98299.1 P-loop containing nucleoside triphosphate hydrolase protein [Fomitiporia mediterranea MF3/22]